MQDINECASNPCLHSGQCSNLINQFTCSCQAGYAGERCEIDASECSSNPCQNGATCVDETNSFRCVCPPGWTSNLCELCKYTLKYYVHVLCPVQNNGTEVATLDF